MISTTETTNNTPELIADSLAYKDDVATRLVDTVHEFLEFSSTRDLIKLLAANF